MKKIFISLLLVCITTSTFSGARGPIQTEYASFEALENTDMVDLKTGDFTYTIPLINTPGPGGGYSIPLAYHAGIELEEEASWVGLGWSLNPGAITRTVVQYPDDFAGEWMTHVSNSPGGHGYSVNWGVYSKYYDSNKGRGGRAGLGDILSIGFGNEQGITALGVTANLRTGKIKGDAVAIATSVATVALIIAFPPAGVKAAVAAGASKAAYYASSVAINAAMSVAGAMIGNAVSGKKWDGNITNESLVMKKWRSGWLKSRKHYKYYFRGSRTDYMYGALYLGEVENASGKIASHNLYSDPELKDQLTDASSYATKMFVNGAVSDVVYNSDDNYVTSVKPTHLGYDTYTVMAKGIEGNISPYRADMGSVAFNPTKAGPNYYYNFDDNYSYYHKGWLHSNSRSNGDINFDYKTQFKYLSELSNGYHHHLSGEEDFDASTNFLTDYALVDENRGNALGTTPAPSYTTPYITGKRVNYGFETDYHYDETKAVEANRTADNSFLNGKLATGRYIQYFTNNELEVADLSGADPTTSVYQDHMGQTDRYNWRATLPDYGIGGFVITNSDGTSYHFTIPVYQYDQYYYSGTSESSFYQFNNTAPIANTWLLTGITGPDYIDRAPLGVIDENDWGYWVQMEYEMLNDDYYSRTPYEDNNSFYIKQKTIYSDVETDWSRVYSETYYLNKIKTATHSTLFFKSFRRDGRCSYNPANTGSNSNIRSTMKLDEVVTVTNEFADYFFQPTAQGGLGAYENNHAAHPSTEPDITSNELSDNFLPLYNVPSTALSALRNNQIKSIKFDYDYSLCDNTPNSFFDPDNIPSTTSGFDGKLTLNHLSFHGRNDVKLSPDYEFSYLEGNALDNPEYDQYKYDGWGFYAAGGSTSRNSHMAVGDADEWSLKEITTPVGSKIIIEYERDEYASLAGVALTQNLFVEPSLSTVDDANNTARLIFDTSLDLTDYLQQGDQIECPRIKLDKQYQTTIPSIVNFQDEKITLLGVGTNYIDIDIPDAGSNYTWTEFNALEKQDYISFYVDQKKGGNIRVSSIAVEDENLERTTTKYIYTVDGTENGPSSGVATMEPDFIHLGQKLELYPQYELNDFPGPWIMYSKVNVLSHYRTTNDFLSREEYQFETPALDQIEISTYEPNSSVPEWQNTYAWENATQTGSGDWNSQTNTYWYDFSRNNKMYMAGINVKVMTSRIGMLKKAVSYNKEGHQYKTVEYNYSNDETLDFQNENIGVFTEGTLLGERIYNTSNGDINHRYFQTVKAYVPTKMLSVSITENGHTKTVENTQWDFLTGAVLETEYEDSYGDRFRTVMKPAYTEYSGMGHKLWNSDNKHMLSKPVSNMLYVERENSPGQWDLVSANAKVWSNTWEYWENDGTQFDWTAGPTNDAWRQKESYYWKANTNDDGTYKSGSSSNDDYVPFDWTNPSAANSNWKSGGSITHYNHNSVVLESRSPRGIYTVQKLGAELYPILSASNANYVEVAFTGVEGIAEPIGSSNYFDKMLIKGGSAAIETNPAHVHTGLQSLEVENGEYGLIYRVHDYSQVLDVNKAYQASVWVKNGNGTTLPTAAQFYIQYRSGGQAPAGSMLAQHTIPLSATNALKAGDWYLFTIDLPKYEGASTVDFMELQLNCGGSSGDKIYLDDYRFYPTTAAIGTMVYDYEEGFETAVLNNRNIASKVTRDLSGRVQKTEVEILDNEASDGNGGFKLKSEHKYNYGRDLN